MKVRTQEIPICDLCSRDGELYTVSSLTGATITIVRCERHIKKLAEQADVSGEMETTFSGGAAGATSDTGMMGGPNASPRRDQLLELVNAKPGLHPREYQELAETTKGAISAAAGRLAKDGLIKTTGSRRGARYWPKGYRIPAEFRTASNGQTRRKSTSRRKRRKR